MGSIRHRCHLSAECILEAEVGEVTHPLWKQYPIKVIHLVLHHAGVKSLDGAVNRCAVRIETTITQAPRTWHETAHPGHRQATLPTLILLRAEKRQHRIHQHRIGYRREVRVTRVVLELEDDDAGADADLRRGNARAIQGPHGVI